MSSEVSALRLELGKREAERERIVGSSKPMLEVFKLIGKVAPSDATVLITGESGTGKELIAEALHRASKRNPHPLVKVSCAALPETLLETELFGHEKGSFTGAMTMRKGRFETANKGTIFLDEIGEMTPGTQTKLLRILQEREFERIGSNVPIKIDIRVITATNRNLAEQVDIGKFREDLYYRLNVIHIHMPPLRDRKEDIPLLVEHFLVKYRHSPGAIPTTISEEAIQKLVAYDWPGNVRELENAIERAVVLSRGNPITIEHLPFGECAARSAIRYARQRRRSPSEDDADEPQTSRRSRMPMATMRLGERRCLQGTGRGAREAADQGGPRSRRRQPHQGGRRARDLSAPALRQDQGIRPGRVSEPMARTATFTATAEARPRGGIAIRLPVDPATIWGERDRYYVIGHDRALSDARRGREQGRGAIPRARSSLVSRPSRRARRVPPRQPHSGRTADLDPGERLRRGADRRAERPALLRVAGDVLSEGLGEMGRGREAPGGSRPTDR